MNIKQFQELVDQLDDKRKALLFKKGHDYGTSTDRLGNFKRMSKVCRLLGLAPESSPTDCALFLALLKIDRWQNLRRQGLKPANESVEDTVLDLLNYIDLAYACEKEEGVQPFHINSTTNNYDFDPRGACSINRAAPLG